MTAREIGADGNIAKETSFTVASFDKSSYEAEAVDAFTGGSSREVRVVSQKDREDLQTALLTELATQAAEKFKNDSTGGKYIVETGSSKITDTTFDAEIGAEANNLALTLTAEFEGVQYAAEDLKPLAAAVLNDQIPAGYELTSDEPSILSAPTQDASKSGQVKLDAEVSSVAIPQVNLDDWKQAVTGKNKTRALSILKEKPEVQSVTIAFQPSWLGMLFGWLPSTDKITVTTQ